MDPSLFVKEHDPESKFYKQEFHYTDLLSQGIDVHDVDDFFMLQKLICGRHTPAETAVQIYSISNNDLFECVSSNFQNHNNLYVFDEIDR